MTSALTTQKRPNAVLLLSQPLRSLTEAERRNCWKDEPSPDGREIIKAFVPPTPEEDAVLEDLQLTLEERLSRGTVKTTVALLARIANHFKSERTAEEWQMLYEDYYDDLQEFSDVYIMRAIKEHRRDHTWFPKVAELRALCVKYHYEEWHRYRQVIISRFGKDIYGNGEVLYSPDNSKVN